MLTIVHGSDLHFGKRHDPSVAEAFLSSVESLAPDLIVLSGDFTQRAKAREYRDAKAYLDRLPEAPVVVTPGNHDVPLYRVFERVFTPYRNYRNYIHEELNTVTRIPGLTVVSLNSVAPRRAIVNGRIRRKQLGFARDAFRAVPTTDFRALVTHHHLAPTPDYQGDQALPSARTVLNAIDEMGVDLVMGGHIHRTFIGNSLDVRPDGRRAPGIVILQSGTTTSLRGRVREKAKNSFNVIRLADSELEITNYLYFRETHRFAPVADHTFPRSPRRLLERDTARDEGQPESSRAAGIPGEYV